MLALQYEIVMLQHSEHATCRDTLRKRERAIRLRAVSALRDSVLSALSCDLAVL